jgi:hypothetical protein
MLVCFFRSALKKANIEKPLCNKWAIPPFTDLFHGVPLVTERFLTRWW